MFATSLGDLTIQINTMTDPDNSASIFALTIRKGQDTDD